MTAIDRTAYPRPGARLTREELTARYNLTDTDLAFVRANARGDTGRLMLAMLLKTRQDLGCFAMPEEVHTDTVAQVASQLGLATPSTWPAEARRTKSLYRYQAAIRNHLCVTPYGDMGERLVIDTTFEAAETMSDPADCRDVINWRPAKTWGYPPRGDKLSHLVGMLWRGKCGGWSGTTPTQSRSPLDRPQFFAGLQLMAIRQPSWVAAGGRLFTVRHPSVSPMPLGLCGRER
jgi:Domain of unknown function (DUF4158)